VGTLGLDSVWVAEAYGFDSPTLMGYLAARTETVEIGSAILNIYSRTPALLAQTAAGLDNVSGGRAILGLGASGPQVIEGWHGMPYSKPLTRTREAIEIIRSAMPRKKRECQGTPLPPPLTRPQPWQAEQGDGRSVDGHRRRHGCLLVEVLVAGVQQVVRLLGVGFAVEVAVQPEHVGVVL